MMIPKNTIEEIRARMDIVDVIGAALPLKRAGSTFKALCPFHDEKTPSFTVNPQRQIYHCFGCGAGGDVFKFVMAQERVDFTTAVRMLAEKAGIRLDLAEEEEETVNKDLLYRIEEEAAQLFQRVLFKSPEAGHARTYLAERELDEETAKDFLIGYAPARWDAMMAWGEKKKFTAEQLEAAGLILKSDKDPSRPYDRFRDRLMFPIRNESGKVIGFSGRILNPEDKGGKYVNSPETALFHKSRILFALDRARKAIVDARLAILCEGQIDCIRCHRAGFHNVAASQGTAITEEHALILKRYTDSILLVLDADTAGQKAALAASEIFFKHGLSVSIAALPKGEDPDLLIRRHGPQAFQAVLDQAKSAVEFQVALLRSREDFSTPQGLLRASRAVLATIAAAPTAVQRDVLLRQAATGLALAETSLRQDLRRMTERQTVRSASVSELPSIPHHPIEEVTLAELLCQHPECIALAKKYLPFEHLCDVDCATIVRNLVEKSSAEGFNLMSALSEAGEECQRLAAQIQATEKTIRGEDANPDGAVKDMILVIWRKALERQRAALRQEMGKPGAGKETLEMQYKQLTLDIKALQQGWNRAIHILDL